MRPLVALTAAALVVRAAALAATWNTGCVYDECFYTELATRLAAGEGFRPHARHFWPPGYIAFLAAHLALGGSLVLAKVSQVLLSTLLVPLAWGVGREAAAPWGDAIARRAAVAAAALVAFHPTLVAYSHYLWSETLFLPLFTGALLLVLAAARDRRPGRAAAAGLLLGAASLIKVLPVYLAPLLAGWLVLRPGPRPWRLRAALLLLGCTFAVIAPWTARNLAVHGRLVLVETTTGKNLVRGNNPVAPANWDWGADRNTRGVLPRTGCDQSDLIELNACLTRHGLLQILTHPGRFAGRVGTKLADLFTPNSFLVRHIRRGEYGDWPPSAAAAAVVGVALFQVALMALALVGWSHGPSSPARSLFGLVVIYVMAVHVITFAMSRFRLPLEPLLAAGAALALAAPARVLQDIRWSRRRWLTLALFVALACAWVARGGGLFYEVPPGAPFPELGGGPGD